MAEDYKRIETFRETPPCMGCTERCVTESVNCHDNCPKDRRGEKGYAAWKQNKDKANQYERYHAQFPDDSKRQGWYQGRKV